MAQRLLFEALGMARSLRREGLGAFVLAPPLAAAAALAVLTHASAPAAPLAGRGGAGAANRSVRLAVAAEAAPPPPPLEFRDLSPVEAMALNAATPFSRLPIRTAPSFPLTGTTAEDYGKAEFCLTQAVYYEAGFEPLDGRRAIAQVVLNRLRHPIFPKTVCGVIYQGSERRTGCQFTFTCDGSLLRAPEPRRWIEAQAVAAEALSGRVEPSVGYATHYHAEYVVPYWMPTLTKLVQIGHHIFYRWPEGMGAPRAFTGVYAGAEPAAPGYVEPEPAAVVLAAAATPVPDPLPASPLEPPHEPSLSAPPAIAPPAGPPPTDPAESASPPERE